MTLFDDPPAAATAAAAATTTAAAPEPTCRVGLVVAYDGAGYRGFAAQRGVTTVGGTLAAALARVLRVPAIELTCAGRTDIGVHGWGQVVTFDVPIGALARYVVDGEIDAVQLAVNKLCGPTIVVRAARIVDDSFDARYSARTRRYRYTIVNRPWPDPFRATTAWHVTAPLDLRSMTLACDPFIGAHDFSSFCRRPKTGDGSEVSLTRRIRSARWDDDGDGILSFWIEAHAFCHQMVRSVVGTLVEVGRGKKKAGEIRGILAARDRRAAGDLAPPQGLCLWAVDYGDQDPFPGL